MADSIELPSFPRLTHRIGAFLLDCLLLSAFLGLSSLVMSPQVRAMGPWGRYVGGLVAVAYFTLGNSRAFHGQTLGKRFFALRLRTVDGGDLSYGNALLRATVLIFPFVLNGAMLPLGIVRNAVTAFVISPIITGVPLATAYLLLFARPTRRGVHDLAAETLVVLTEVRDQSVPRLKRLHLGVVGLVILAASIVPNLIVSGVEQRYPDLMPLVLDVGTIPTVSSPQASHNTRTFRRSREPPEVTRSLVITVASSGDDANSGSLIEAMARKAFAHPSALAGAEKLIVRVRYGIDLFLFRWTNWQGRSETLETWRSELGLAP